MLIINCILLYHNGKNKSTKTTNYSFDAYGNQSEENEVYNPFGYRGEYTDEETGFIYLRARYYDTETGRFVSEDPIRDGLNWYVYCNGNPVNYVDPLGLIVTAWDKAHCTPEEITKLQEATIQWNQGVKGTVLLTHLKRYDKMPLR